MRKRKKKIHVRCPKCLSNKILTTPGVGSKAECEDCGHTWAREMSSYLSTKRALNNETGNLKLSDRQKLGMRYRQLKIDLNNALEIKSLEKKHTAIKVADKEFSIICKKKYEQYFPIGTLNEHNKTESHKTYLNSRCRKMINDIDRILFYFDK